MKDARSPNSLLAQLALWTTAVTLVCVMTVSLLAWSSLQGQIREKAEHYYQQRFDYACELIEGQLLAPVALFHQEFLTLSSMREKLRPLTLRLSSQTAITDFYKILQSKVISNSQMADIAVYSVQNGFVLSGRSGVYFLDDRGVRTPFDSEWISMLEGVGPQHKAAWLPARSLPGGMGVEGEAFSLVCYINYSNKEEETLYLCLSVLSDALFACADTEPGEAFFVVNAAGETVVGEGTLSARTGGGAGVFVEGDSVCFVARSSCPGWRYVFRVPYARYTGNGQPLAWQVLTVSAAVFLLMSAVSLVVINRLTSPFSRILARARELRAQDYGRKHGDMRFVADVFDEYVAKAETEQNLLEERLSLLKRGFLLALMHGKHMEIDEIASYTQFLKLDMPRERFTAVVAFSPTGSFTQEEEARVNRALEECAQDAARLFSAGAYGRKLYALVNHRADFDVAAALYGALGRLDVPPVCAAVGEPMAGLSGVDASLGQAERAMVYASYYPDRRVLRWADTRALDERHALDAELTDKLFASISAERWRETAYYLKAACAAIVENGVAYSAANALIAEVALRVGEMRSREAGAVDWESGADFYLSERFARLISAVEELSRQALDEKPDYAESAAEYIRENFAEDIAIPDIADHLGVSRSYLSRLFKEAHGMTILEYILSVRLSEAVRLLNDTELSATEIAGRVGFNNSNYFFKKFKEKFGVTPIQYRNEQL